MALGNLGPILQFDQDGDDLLDRERYLNVSVQCAFERADMDLRRDVFDQLMKGPRFMPLLRHMALTKHVGMKWNYFSDDVFIDQNDKTFHLCTLCQQYAPLRCACKCAFYCGVECQRRNWRIHKMTCSLYGK